MIYPSQHSVVFNGWDAYKYSCLRGKCEVQLHGGRWGPHDPALGYNCGCTYRFTPEVPVGPPKLNRAYTDDEAYSKACADQGAGRYFTAQGSWHAALKWLRTEVWKLRGDYSTDRAAALEKYGDRTHEGEMMRRCYHNGRSEWSQLTALLKPEETK